MRILRRTSGSGVTTVPADWVRRLAQARSTGPVLRAVVLFADYLLAMVTVFWLVPNIGVFIYDNSAVDPAMNLDGHLTFWLIPFAVATVFLVALELMAMRGLWRATGRLLVRARVRAYRVSADLGDEAGDGDGATTTPATHSTPPARRQSKTAKRPARASSRAKKIAAASR